MPITSCRGKKKLEIVEKFELTPIAHLALLSGQKKQGCCGKVTNRYYVFNAKHKTTGEEDFFYVGYDCADQFLELTGKNPLPLFNPIVALGTSESNRSNSGNSNQSNIAPLNKELYNAIHILCAAWDKPPQKQLLKSLMYIRNRPHIPTQNFAITNFNRILSYDTQKRTLGQIIDQLKQRNPNLRKFTFLKMQKVLDKENEVSYL